MLVTRIVIVLLAALPLASRLLIGGEDWIGFVENTGGSSAVIWCWWMQGNTRRFPCGPSSARLRIALCATPAGHST